MPIVFEVASPPSLPTAGRADIACFVGQVARRRGAPLPPAVRQALVARGWIDGPWRIGPERIAALEQLPVALDSWSDFDRLYCWDSRPVAEGSTAVGAGALGAAVRSYFANGGRRALIVRTGDPWPLLDRPTPAEREARLRRLLPDGPGDPADPASWRGVEHLHGLEEAAMLCLPDLPELYAMPPGPPAAEVPLRPLPEGFVECSAGEAPAAPDGVLRRIAAPRLDAAGWAGWSQAVGRIDAILSRPRRAAECLFVGALPLPALGEGGADAEGAAADPLAALLDAGVIAAGGSEPQGAGSRFVQLAWPWLRTGDSGDLAEGLVAPDGVLAGMIAAGALARGCFRSIAGSSPLGVVDAVPAPDWGLAPESPWQRLARRICVFAPEPGGWRLQSDVTSWPHEPWRGGPAARVMAGIRRAAREIGAAQVFGASGPALWPAVRAAFEQLLLAWWQVGGLGGASPAAAFDVRCDRTTMTASDLDAGRIVVQIELLPVAAVERITVSLALGSADSAGARLAQAA